MENNTGGEKNWYDKEISSQSAVANLLIIGGLACGIYFLMFFDASVAVPQQEFMGQTIGGGRVNNIGLMQDQQNGIYLGFGAAAVGLVLGFIGNRRKDESSNNS